MKKAKYALVISLFLSSIILQAQFKLYNWQSHTSLFDASSLAYDDNGKVWVGTSGGVFVYNLKDSSIRTIRNIDELLSNSISTICINKGHNEVYFGSSNGYLDILQNETDWVHITDIKVKGFTNPVINNILFNKDLAYLACGFGLSVFDSKDKVFRETVQKFGSFPINTPVNKILLHANYIYLATDEGIAFADTSALISDPKVWTNLVIGGGLQTKRVFDIMFKDDSLFAMTDKFILSLVGDKLLPYLQTEEDLKNFVTIETNKIGYSTQYYIFKDIKNAFFAKNFALVNNAIFFNYQGKKVLAIAYAKDGLGIVINDSLNHIKPNSPSTNRIGDISISNDGTLYCTAPKNGANGFMSFTNNIWINYVSAKFPKMESNNFFKINSGKANIVYGSNYGNGLLIGDLNKNEFTVYNRSNSNLVGIVGGPDYIICGETALDNNGTLWVVNYGEISSGPILIALDKNRNFYGFENKQNPNDRFFISLAIDFNGTKWVGGSDNDNNGKGMYYFNENNTLSNPADDKSRFITTSTNTGLPSNVQTSLKVDKNGWLWIGTPEGLGVIRNTSAVLGSGNVDISYMKNLGSIYVHDIMIDAQNNKWIATNSGIWILTNDGGEVIANITTSNSPLPTNEILTLATDESTGKVFIGTKIGLYEVQSLNIAPSSEYNINCYPQPFYPQVDSQLLIEGLAEETEIKITTINGELVRTLRTQSKTTIWDGRNEKGQYVTNGIYLIIAYSSVNNAGAVSKIAVVSK